MPRLEGIEVELGITAEINGTYIKPTARLKLSFEGNEAQDKELVTKTWDNAWDAASREVERVIMSYAESSNGVININPKGKFSADKDKEKVPK